MRKSDFTPFLGRLCDAFGKSNLAPSRQDLYFQEVNRTGASCEETLAAVDRIIRQNRYFPSVSEILSALRETVGNKSRTDYSLEWERLRAVWFSRLKTQTGSCKISESELYPLVARDFASRYPGQTVPSRPPQHASGRWQSVEGYEAWKSEASARDLVYEYPRS